MMMMMGHLRLLFVTALIALSTANNPYEDSYEESYYEELGLSCGATPEQIKEVKNKAKL